VKVIIIYSLYLHLESDYLEIIIITMITINFKSQLFHLLLFLM